MSGEIFQLVVWFTVIELASFVGLPAALYLFRNSPPPATAFSYCLGFLALCYPSWLGASLGIFSFANSILIGVFCILLLGNIFLVWNQHQKLIPWFQINWKTVVWMKVVFWIVFLVLAWVRSHNPTIYGAEKFMDFAMINSLIRETDIPPEDPWLSGETINYYYFGYLIVAVLTRLTSIDSAFTFNLSLSLLFGLTFLGVYAVVLDLTRKNSESETNRNPSVGQHLAAGLGGFLVVIIGNLDGFLQWIERRSLFPFDYFRSSRVLTGAIDEFPYFSFLHGDLHPHVIALPFTLLFVGLAIHMYRTGMDRFREQRIHWITIVFLLGALNMINTWDYVTYASLLLFLAAAGSWERGWRPFSAPSIRNRLMMLLIVLAMIPLALVWFLPFHLSVDLPFRGIGFLEAADRSGIGQWIIMFGLFWTILIAGWIEQFRSSSPFQSKDFVNKRLLPILIGAGLVGLIFQSVGMIFMVGVIGCTVYFFVQSSSENDPNGVLLNLLLLFGFLILASCEIFYFKDSYGIGLKRMNTIFKFYYPAWVLLGIGCAVLVYRVVPILQKRYTFPILARYGFVFIVLLGMGMAYPVGATLQHCGFFRNPSTLDGTQYLLRDHPGDARAIRWLKRTALGNEVVLEATGNPYGYFARVSSNTGLPTLLGWANHESVWRGNQIDLGARQADIRTLYTSPDPQQQKRLLDRYQIEWVFVGELERQSFSHMNLVGLQEWMEVAYNEGDTRIFRRKR